MRMVFKLGLVALMLQACSSCSPTTRLVITGESLIGLGDQFVATSQLMDIGLDAKTITKEQYKTWSTFGKRFQQVYPVAVQLWDSSRAVGDTVTEGHAAEILTTLTAELAEFYSVINRANITKDIGNAVLNTGDK